jgi:hypothetical protein
LQDIQSEYPRLSEEDLKRHKNDPRVPVLQVKIPLDDLEGVNKMESDEW